MKPDIDEVMVFIVHRDRIAFTTITPTKLELIDAFFGEAPLFFQVGIVSGDRAF
jgi:hypothetical protein